MARFHPGPGALRPCPRDAPQLPGRAPGGRLVLAPPRSRTRSRWENVMQSLLATLAALHVKIEVRDGKLHVNAPAGALTPELQKEIGRHRDELIELLQEIRPAAAPESELPRIVPDPERAHEPFPLNDVQHAYWIGRSGH